MPTDTTRPQMSTNSDATWKFPGARWWRFDLHTHTPVSDDYGKGPQQATLRELAPRDWLLDYMRAGIDCVAVTDHNSAEWIDPLKEALAVLQQEGHPDFRPMTLFPGVEITANGGVHILAVLDASCRAADVNMLLGAVEFDGTPGTSNSAARHSAIQVVEEICKAGGVPILAHVDGPSGAWKSMKGNSLAPLLEAEGLFALEVVDPDHKKPQIYQDRKLNWAEVIGSDSHHRTGGAGSNFPGSRYTWIKMASPSLDGLRLALLDGGDSSIRRSDAGPFDPFVVPKYMIEAIEISDAKYMGRGTSARIDFSPWLNAVVGGRGTGKSTVLHALRLVARRRPELADLESRIGPLATFEEFCRVPTDPQDYGGLTEQTTIRWLLKRDDVLYRVRWSQDANEVVVEYYDEEWKISSSQDISPQRFPLRLFSQGQIGELAGRNQALLRIVDEGSKIETWQRSFNEARAAFAALQARIRAVDQRLMRYDSLVVELQDRERKLERFEAAKDRERLVVEYRRRKRQQRVLKEQFQNAEQAAIRIEEVAKSLALEDIPDGVFSEHGDPGPIEVIEKLNETLGKVAKKLLNASNELQNATKWKYTRTRHRQSWLDAVRASARDYRAFVRQLRSEGVADPSEYDNLIQERSVLTEERDVLNSVREEKQRLADEAADQLQAVLTARQEMTNARNSFLSKALSDNRFVRIAIRAYGNDKKAVARVLKELLAISDDRFQNDILSEAGDKGLVAEIFGDLPAEDAERRAAIERKIRDLKTRMESVRSGSAEFRRRFNDYVQRKLDESPALLDKILTWFPEDELVVEYSPKGNGKDFRPIGQASAGQRSAAMLAFLLAYGDEPLVLDQPEDDLDNQLIYELVVQQMRENKRRRQIIVVTHNANVVVNGDAELVQVMRFARGQCVMGKSGSLDDPEMREEICQIMEGGQEAFGRRYRRLGRGPHDV